MSRTRTIIERLYKDQIDFQLKQAADKFSVLPKQVVEDLIHDSFSELMELIHHDQFREVRNVPVEKCLAGRAYAALCLWLNLAISHRLSKAATNIRRERELAKSYPEEVGESMCDDFPGSSVITAEHKLLVQAAVETLTHRESSVIQLRFAEGLPFSEIANQLNMTVSAAQKTKSRAIAKLRHRPHILSISRKEEE